MERSDKHKQKFRKGFTLIEIMLVVALIAVIGSVSAPVYQSFQVKNNLGVAAQTVAQSLRRAQALSRSGENDSAWGVRVASGSVILFKGSTFSGRDVSFDEDSEISSDIVLSGISEVAYSKLAGMPQAVGSIILTTSNGDIETISVNEKGTIEY